MRKILMFSLIALLLLGGFAIAELITSTINGKVELDKEQYKKIMDAGFNELSIDNLNCTNTICTFNVCINDKCLTRVVRVRNQNDLELIILQESKKQLLNWADTILNAEQSTKQIIEVIEK